MDYSMPGVFSFHTKVAGVTHDGRQTNIARLHESQSLYAVRRPNNPYDSNAIELLDIGDRSIGFIPRETAAKIAPKIDAGYSIRVTVSSITGGGDCWYGVNIFVKMTEPE